MAEYITILDRFGRKKVLSVSQIINVSTEQGHS